ncbi:hypothetical protein DFR30_2077 [Thiogranum longum]|uniref:Uncharacterized protein n=1 Tax=Thiogranum longum TaxID=1537524 RepID=A0A4R1HDS7_9GAMM|nr:hypothetical protein [Thiogranum longum]TCK18793.1 hypothetical protein DFR30_2077 [Thiogranum longum]
MNMHEKHPDSEQLDSLRAGLLDDNPELKADVEAHLDNCTTCRKLYDLAGHLLPGRLPVDTPAVQLDQIRQQALQARSSRHRLLPFAVAAALALVAVVLVKPSLQDTPPDIRVAQNPQETGPVLYEDLDFYLWLADHKENSDSST